jgi:hypothetical protein
MLHTHPIAPNGPVTGQHGAGMLYRSICLSAYVDLFLWCMQPGCAACVANITLVHTCPQSIASHVQLPNTSVDRGTLKDPA